MSEENEESTAFLRQRRDLFVISAILILIPLAQIKIANKISLQQLGITLEIGNPKMIIYALWALWAYWYLRYFQVHRAIRRSHVSENYRAFLSNYAHAKFRELAVKNQDSLRKIMADKYKVNIEKVEFSPINPKTKELGLFHYKFTWEPRLGIEGEITSFNNTFDDVVINIGVFSLFWIRAKTIFTLIIGTDKFTEYSLPYIFGLLPLCLLLYLHFIH
jgi:uncharacterized LabA/DUF88 family protein